MLGIDDKKSPKHKIAMAYRWQAKIYNKYAPESFSWRFLDKPTLDRFIKPDITSEIKILDAGCGTGRVIKYLLESGVHPSNITGVDLSYDMLRIAKRSLSHQIGFIRSDISVDLFAPESFDLIICSMMITYLDPNELQKTLSHFYKWLNPGGTVYIYCVHPIRNVHQNLSEYQKEGWRFEKTPWNTKLPYYQYTLTGLLNAVVIPGFKIETVDEPYPPPEAQDEGDYNKYTSYPSRIMILAKKT